MNWSNSNPNLDFNQPSRSIPRILIVIVITLVVFTLLWIYIPHEFLYWILMLFLTAVMWVANYGWRRALSILINLLHRLEQM